MKAPPKLRRLVLGIAGLLAILAVLFLRSRGWNSNPIACRGGEAFQHFLVIETPVYLQRDRAWEADRIGGTGETLGRVGCTVCCLAMETGVIVALLQRRPRHPHPQDKRIAEGHPDPGQSPLPGTWYASSHCEQSGIQPPTEPLRTGRFSTLTRASLSDW